MEKDSLLVCFERYVELHRQGLLHRVAYHSGVPVPVSRSRQAIRRLENGGALENGGGSIVYCIFK